MSKCLYQNVYVAHNHLFRFFIRANKLEGIQTNVCNSNRIPKQKYQEKINKSMKKENGAAQTHRHTDLNNTYK